MAFMSPNSSHINKEQPWKIKTWLYLSTVASNKETKDTFHSSTLKIEKSKCAFIFVIFGIWTEIWPHYKGRQGATMENENMALSQS